MSDKHKDISIKNYLYYFFDDFINIKNFGSNNIEIVYLKKIFFYYVTIKDSKYVKINSINP